MITTITPLRRAAVTLALTDATALGAIAIAPAAFADELPTVTEQAPVMEPAPQVVVPEAAAPQVVVPEAARPVVEPAPVPAPVVTSPPVVIGKDGKPVAAPKVCSDKDLAEYAAKVAKYTAQAAPITRAAAKLREASAALRAQVGKLTPSQARAVQALAGVSDLAASKLEAQANDVIAKAGSLSCLVVTAPGGRF